MFSIFTRSHKNKIWTMSTAFQEVLNSFYWLLKWSDRKGYLGPGTERENMNELRSNAMQTLQQSWLQSQIPPTQWNLRGGIWICIQIIVLVCGCKYWKKEKSIWSRKKAAKSLMMTITTVRFPCYFMEWGILFNCSCIVHGHIWIGCCFSRR